LLPILTTREPSALSPQPSALSPQPSTVKPWLLILTTREPSTFSPQPSTLQLLLPILTDRRLSFSGYRCRGGSFDADARRAWLPAGCRGIVTLPRSPAATTEEASCCCEAK
jgi:hypothetical protein